MISLLQILLIQENLFNMAEVAFSISKDYQSRGLGKILIRKLAEAARGNGVSGLFAVTSSVNKKMINY